MKKYLNIFILIIILLMTSCTNNVEEKSERTRNSKDGEERKELVWKYKESDKSDIKFDKSVYSEDELVLYITTPSNLNLEVNYITDDKFKYIDCDFDIKVKKNKIIIKGSKAEKISGLMLGNNNVQYWIRYIDSDQYAVLTDYWADDLGWDTYGDETEYYTQEELDKREEVKSEIIRKDKEAFETFEGYYICPDDENLYINIYVNENDIRCLDMVRLSRSGDYQEEGIVVDYADMVESRGGYSGPVVEFTEEDALSYEIVFMYSEDKNILYEREDAPHYVRQ